MSAIPFKTSILEFERFNDEVIDRLHLLNIERVAEENEQGLTKGATKKKSLKKKTLKTHNETNSTLDLF